MSHLDQEDGKVHEWTTGLKGPFLHNLTNTGFQLFCLFVLCVFLTAYCQDPA